MYPKSNPILTEIQDELAEIGEMKTIKFLWTPGHGGTSGKEKAMVVAADMITRAKFNAKK
jgi:hypothetical protein